MAWLPQLQFKQCNWQQQDREGTLYYRLLPMVSGQPSAKSHKESGWLASLECVCVVATTWNARSKFSQICRLVSVIKVRLVILEFQIPFLRTLKIFLTFRIRMATQLRYWADVNWFVLKTLSVAFDHLVVPALKLLRKQTRQYDTEGNLEQSDSLSRSLGWVQRCWQENWHVPLLCSEQLKNLQPDIVW